MQKYFIFPEMDSAPRKLTNIHEWIYCKSMQIPQLYIYMCPINNESLPA